MTDRELVQEAVREAGTQKALAEIFGVSQSAISEWGRTRGSPRQVRPRLESYIAEQRATISRRVDSSKGSCDSVGVTGPMRELIEFGKRSSLDDFPKRYRTRLEERLRELTQRFRRELDDYLNLLRAEYRVEHEKRKNKNRKSKLPR